MPIRCQQIAYLISVRVSVLDEATIVRNSSRKMRLLMLASLLPAAMAEYDQCARASEWHVGGL